MRKCHDCGGEMEEKEAFTPEGVRYRYFRCSGCGEEIVDMSQLHAVAEKYRTMKLYHATMTRWGRSLGVRIPNELVSRYHLRPNEEVAIIPEKGGLRIIPNKSR